MDWLATQSSRRGFEEFVVASADHLLRTAYLIVSDQGRAEDLVQEAFVKVARRWGGIQAMDYPLAYTRRIVVNLALDDHRRWLRRPDCLTRTGELVDKHHNAASDAMAAVELRDGLARTLAVLPLRQRTTLVLRYWEDLSETEVAVTMGCSVGTVKTQLSRGLKRLKQVLAPTQ